MKKQKMKIGKRYWLDGQKDISGLYVGDAPNGAYLFRGLTNNYMYMNNADGNVPMPASGKYEPCGDRLIIF